MSIPQLSMQTDNVESAHLFIDDEIAAGKVTADGFCEALRQTRAKTVHVHIDSNGGSVGDGLAIYDALMSYPGEVVVHVDGLCASICPVIAMAGRRILMAADAVMLVHHTSATISGTFPEILATARGMAVHEVKMMNALTSRSGASVEQILSVMKSERLLNAQEALELGLCTEIVPEKGLACTWDFQGVVQSTDAIVTAIANYRRSWARVPKQQILPTSYLFQTPNFASVTYTSGTFSQLPTIQLLGSYAVWRLVNDGQYSYLDVAGYYDQELTASGYTGGSTLFLPGHNASIGSVFAVRYANNLWRFTVISISGSTLTGTSVSHAISSNVLGFTFPYLLSADQKARRQIRNKTDDGSTINLVAQQVEEYYLPGVSPDIATASDIPTVQPYSVQNYLAAWAGSQTWFTVQASQVAAWQGPILRASYIQCSLAGIP